MRSRLHRFALLALYQVTLLLGIVLMPLALVTRQVGFRLPLDRLLTRLGDAYERAAQS